MALSFSNDSLTRTANLPAWNAFTACGWARLTTDNNNYSTLFSLENSGSSEFVVFQTDVDGTSLLVYVTSGPSSNVATLTANTNFFWAVTSDGSNVRIYYAAEGSAALNTVSIAFTDSFVPATMWIGNNGFTEFFTGDIGNVIVWNEVKTQAFLESQRARVLPFDTTNLNIWSPLSSASDEVIDYSGNGRNWTRTGTLPLANNFPVTWGTGNRYLQTVGTSSVSGTIAVTEASDTSAISGTSTVNGSLSETEDSDTSAIAGNSTITGALAGVEVADTSSVAGSPTVVGSLAETEEDDTSTISGTTGEVVGTIAVTEDSDTGALSGTSTVSGSFANVEADDTSAIAGNSTVIGTLTPTDGADTSAIAGNVAIPGSLAETEDNDTSAISGSVGDAVTGTLSGVEASDTSAVAGTSSVIGTIAEVEDSDSASFSGLGFIIGVLAVTDAVDVLEALGSPVSSGVLNPSDEADSGSLTGSGIVVGSLAETEENDTMSTRVGTPFTKVTYSINQPKVKSSGFSGNIWQIKPTSR